MSKNTLFVDFEYGQCKSESFPIFNRNTIEIRHQLSAFNIFFLNKPVNISPDTSQHKTLLLLKKVCWNFKNAFVACKLYTTRVFQLH